MINIILLSALDMIQSENRKCFAAKPNSKLNVQLRDTEIRLIHETPLTSQSHQFQRLDHLPVRASKGPSTRR